MQQKKNWIIVKKIFFFTKSPERSVVGPVVIWQEIWFICYSRFPVPSFEHFRGSQESRNRVSRELHALIMSAASVDYSKFSGLPTIKESITKKSSEAKSDIQLYVAATIIPDKITRRTANVGMGIGHKKRKIRKSSRRGK